MLNWVAVPNILHPLSTEKRQQSLHQQTWFITRLYQEVSRCIIYIIREETGRTHRSVFRPWNFTFRWTGASFVYDEYLFNQPVVVGADTGKGGEENIRFGDSPECPLASVDGAKLATNLGVWYTTGYIFFLKRERERNRKGWLVMDILCFVSPPKVYYVAYRNAAEPGQLGTVRTKFRL